jgi:formylglycine-generating enzyme required for sulfatase activity
MQAADGEGFNDHYSFLAAPRLEQARALAYTSCFEQAQAALENDDLVQALHHVEKAVVYRPGFAPAVKLRNEIMHRVEGDEDLLFEAAEKREERAGLDAFRTAVTASERDALARAMKGYESYLDIYPVGRWADRSRAALQRLNTKKLDLPEGFSFLREETFRCGGNANTLRVYLHEKTGLEFVLIPGGTYTMGIPSGLLGLSTDLSRFESEHPPHRVTLKSFLICRTECTQAAWDRIGGRDSREWHDEDLPIMNVSWEDSAAWCREAGLRLPSEAEWEYACRAGTRTRYCFGESSLASGLSDYAWYVVNSERRAHPVARKMVNAFGLHDVHGNVWEWCQDTYQHGYAGAPADGSAWEKTGSDARVRRGGGFLDRDRSCRSAWRGRSRAAVQGKNIGFRPAASLP